MEQITECIQPELLVLVPVLYTIGTVLKNSEKVKDRYIPLLLTIIGVAMALLCEAASFGISPTAIFAGLCQGVLCAGATVYANQMYKQAKEDT